MGYFLCDRSNPIELLTACGHQKLLGSAEGFSIGLCPSRRLTWSNRALPQPTASPISLGSAQAMPIPVYRDSVPGDACPGLIGLCPGRRPSRSHRALPRTRSFPVCRQPLPRASLRERCPCPWQPCAPVHSGFRTSIMNWCLVPPVLVSSFSSYRLLTIHFSFSRISDLATLIT